MDTRCFCGCSEIAAGNFTDETTVPGFPVEFFPVNHGDNKAYEDMAVDRGLDLSAVHMLVHLCRTY